VSEIALNLSKKDILSIPSHPSLVVSATDEVYPAFSSMISFSLEGLEEVLNRIKGRELNDTNFSANEA
jgi:hypothetical protein